MQGLDMLNSVQFVVDREGHRSAVQMSVDDWDMLLNYLEDLEDKALIKDALPRLVQGPEKAGALAWEDVRIEWEDDQ